MKQLEKLETDGITVKMCGEIHEFKCVMLCMAHIAKFYDTPQKAIERMFELATKEVDGKLVLKEEAEMFTVELMELMNVFCSGLLKHELSQETDSLFGLADVSEFPGIINGIIQAMGLGQPEPSKKKVSGKK